MTFRTTLSLIAVILSLALAVFVLLRDRHSFVHRLFAVGIMAFALEAGLIGLSFRTTSATEFVYWQRLKLIVGSSLPGIWLFFSLSFARTNYKEFIAKWKWVLLASFIFPLSMITFFAHAVFLGKPILDESFALFIRLGWSGYAYYLFFLLAAVLILMNLERTLRTSIGRMRWQIKYMVLGLGSLFGVRIYVVSQNVLFQSVNPDLEVLNVGALVVASVLILNSFFRSGLLNVKFYLSQSLLYDSFTVLLVGIYLLAVGVLAKVAAYFKGTLNIPFEAFLVFLALVVLTILLLSDRLRSQMRRIISRHFKRPLYDYRKEWERFTEETSSVTEIKNLCSIVTKRVSKTLGVLSVSIWLADESQDYLVLGGSTVFSEGHQRRIEPVGNVVNELVQVMLREKLPVDFDYSTEDWPTGEIRFDGDSFKQTRIRYCIPLIAKGKFLGVMTLGDQVGRGDFSVEDFDLLRTITDQTAGNLLNLKLSEDLRQAKELEAFQTVSAFMIHDLKNLASRLSLTVENLPTHFGNPEFRKDALNVISQSVTKINNMCSSLSILSQEIEINRAKIDLNKLVSSTLLSLNGCLKVPLIQNLQPLPELSIDAEQVQKVLTNLVLNANEAMTDGGEIQVVTEQRDGWITMMVRDNGCGMSKEFIEGSLFRPFKTTKKQGMGIGLFQSKKIIEAHGGKIKVESKEGKGSTFRVFLPMAGK